MGNIEDLWQRKDGTRTARYGGGKRYRASPWLARPGGHRARGASKTFHDRADAAEYIAQVEAGDEAALAAKGVDIARARRRPRFADYVREVARTMGTGGTYLSQGKKLAEQWPTQRLDEITHDMVEDYFAQLLAEGASASTRAKRRSTLRETMRRAFRARFINDDPTEGTEPVNQRVRKDKGERLERCTCGATTVLARPDFAELYPGDDGVMPRVAAQLWIAANLLADPSGAIQPSDWLPPVAAASYGTEFAEEMREVVIDLRDRIAAGRLGPANPRNMAEQVALGAILTEAEAVAEQILEDREYEPWVATLPTDDDDLDGALDVLFEDTDHHYLYQPEYDGIENDQEVLGTMRMRLHPREWLVPFRRLTGVS